MAPLQLLILVYLFRARLRVERLLLRLMKVKPEVIDLRIPCQSKYAHVVRELVADAAEKSLFPPSAVSDLRAAVGEAFVGCKKRRAKQITISVRLGGDSLVVEIEDDGKPAFSKRLVTSAKPLARKPSKESLIMSLVDDFQLELQAEGGTKTTLVKKLTSG